MAEKARRHNYEENVAPILKDLYKFLKERLDPEDLLTVKNYLIQTSPKTIRFDPEDTSTHTKTKQTAKQFHSLLKQHILRLPSSEDTKNLIEEFRTLDSFSAQKMVEKLVKFKRLDLAIDSYNNCSNKDKVPDEIKTYVKSLENIQLQQQEVENISLE